MIPPIYFMFIDKATAISFSGYINSENKRPPDNTKKTYTVRCTKCSQIVLMEELKNG